MLLSAVNFDTNMLIGLAVDVLVVALLLLFAVVGAKKGIIKMSFGLITMVAVFLGSLLLVSPVSKVLINNTNLDNQLMSALERPIGTKLPGSYSFVYYHDLDNDPETPDELVIDKDNIPMPYDYVFEGTIYQQFGLHKLMRPMVENTLKNGDSDRIYLVDAITFSIASIIIMAATFIVLIIVLRIIMAILMRLLKKSGGKPVYRVLPRQVLRPDIRACAGRGVYLSGNHPYTGVPERLVHGACDYRPQPLLSHQICNGQQLCLRVYCR